MRDDVRKLMQRAGLPEDRYREIAADERRQGAESDWSLLAAVNRRLAIRHGAAGPPGRFTESA